MQDRELYEQILGLSSPWKVAKVELKADVSQFRRAFWRTKSVAAIKT